MLDAFLPLALSLEEDVIKSVVVAHDICVDAGILHVEKHLGLSFEVAEVLVCIGIVYAVVRAAAVIRQDGEVHHVLAGFLVINGLWSPYSCDVLEHRALVAIGEMDGVVLPLDEVAATHEYHAAVAAPAQARLHVGNNLVEPSVFATQDMRVANAFSACDGIAGDNGQPIVHRGIVPAIVA